MSASTSTEEMRVAIMAAASGVNGVFSETLKAMSKQIIEAMEASIRNSQGYKKENNCELQTHKTMTF